MLNSRWKKFLSIFTCYSKNSIKVRKIELNKNFVYILPKMNLVDCITELSRPVQSEHFEEANQAMVQMKENNPFELLQGFCEIINSEIEVSMKEKAIKMMTMVIGRLNTTYSLISRVPPEFTGLAFETLFPLLQNNDNIANVSRQTLTLFLCACKDIQTVEEIFGKILENFSAEVPDFYFEAIINLLGNCEYLCVNNIHYAVHVINVIREKEMSDEMFKKTVNVVSLLVPLKITEEEIQTEECQLIIEFFFYATERSPKSTFELASHIFVDETFAAFPDLSQRLLEFVCRDPAFIYCLKGVYNFYPFTKQQLFELLGFIIQNISIEEEEIVDNDKDFYFVTPFFDEPLKSKLIDDIFRCYPSLISEIVPFITEHIQENGTNEKYAASILNYRADRTVDRLRKKEETKIFFSEKLRETEELPPLEELYPIDKAEILSFLTEDENPKVQRYGLFLQAGLVSEGRIEITEELIEQAFQLFYSEDQTIVDGGEMMLISIAKANNEEVNTAIVSALWENVQSAETQEEVASLQRIFQFLKRLTPFLTKTIANTLAEEVWGYCSAVFQEDSNAMQVGWCVGVLGGLVKIIGAENEAFITDLTGFVSALFEEENEKDALFLITEICNTAGGNNQEILEFCVNYVIEHIPSAEDANALESLVKLTEAVINYIEDPELLDHIVVFMIEYLKVVKRSKFCTIIMLSGIITKIFRKNQDVVTQHAGELCETNFRPFYIYDIKNHDLENQLNILMFNTAVQIGNKRTARMFLSAHIHNVVFAIRNAKLPERKSKLLSDLLDLAAPSAEALGQMMEYDETYNVLSNACPEDKREIFNQCIIPFPKEEIK